MSGYTQLTQEERYQIFILKKANSSQAEIAGLLGRDKSTINRELRRNRGLKGYRPQQLHNLALGRRYVKNTGIGTVTAMMLPYSLTFFVLWTLFLLAYWALGFPLELQASYEYVAP